MKSTFISKEDNKVKFTMDFTAEELEQATIRVYQRSKDKYPVDGFRKGKAPRSIIEKRYGENVFMEEAINDLFNAEYPKAIGELELAVIDAPRVEFSDISGEITTVKRVYTRSHTKRNQSHSYKRFTVGILFFKQ